MFLRQTSRVIRCCSSKSDKKGKSVSDIVFRNAVQEKHIIIQDATKELAEPAPRDPNIPKEVVVKLNQDEMWKDWEQIEKTLTSDEILDVPEYASMLTVHLRMVQLSLRTREDKYFNISKYLRNHMKRRRVTYKNAFQTLKHMEFHRRSKAKALFSLRNIDKYNSGDFQVQNYSNFINGRMQRDLLTMYKEDSITRHARVLIRIDARKREKEYWKQDEFYWTKTETKLHKYKEMARLAKHAIKLPFIFIIFRTAVTTAEHTSLMFDYARMIAKGYKPVTVQNDQTTPLDNPMHESLRRRISHTRDSSPVINFIVFAAIGTMITFTFFYVKEARLPLFLVPENEREFLKELYADTRIPTTSQLGSKKL